jgi:hypothetical protein
MNERDKQSTGCIKAANTTRGRKGGKLQAEEGYWR